MSSLVRPNVTALLLIIRIAFAWTCPRVDSFLNALLPCPQHFTGGLCGYLMRPLDPDAPGSPLIPVFYRLRRPTNDQQSAVGTLMGMTGGPGYGSTGTAAEYERLWGDGLLLNHATVTVDQRGTGCSGTIVCPSVQNSLLLTLTNMSVCAAQLGPWSDLYGMQLAAADAAAILAFLNITIPVDLFGESYGTFAAQAFAGHYPAHVRTLVLDGAYAVTSTDGWYSTMGQDTRAAFERACARSPQCPANVSRELASVLLELRANAPRAPSVVRGGRTGPLAPADLAFTMATAGLNPVVYSELPAALVAFNAGFYGALVRLVNVAYQYYEGSAGGASNEYSMGMFAATMCQDAPQVFNMSQSPPDRTATLAALFASKQSQDPEIFSPFTVGEWAAGPPDYTYLTLCASWPATTAAHPQGKPLPPNASLPQNVPVFVLTGDLDTITPIGQGDETGAQFPPSMVSRLVVPNGIHVVALDGPQCLRALVRTFITTGFPAPPADVVTCLATAYPAWRVLPVFPATCAAAPPATLLAGTVSTFVLQVLAAIVYTAADAVNHWLCFAVGETGLYGGSWAVVAPNELLLTSLRWSADLSVSGNISILDDEFKTITGALHFEGPTVAGLAEVRWQAGGVQSLATINATLISGAGLQYTDSVQALVPAP